jgi:hypothetical protein
MGVLDDEGTATERLERQVARDVPSAFWLRPNWGDKANLRDPGTTPFWMRPPRILDIDIKKDIPATDTTVEESMVGIFLIDKSGFRVVDKDGTPLVDKKSASRPLSVRSTWLDNELIRQKEVEP